MNISTKLAVTAFAVIASIGVVSADQYDGRGYRGNYYNGRDHGSDCGCDTCKPACSKPACCQPTQPTCCKPYKYTCAPVAPCEPVKKCCGPQTPWVAPNDMCSCCGGNHVNYRYGTSRSGYNVKYIDTTYTIDSHNQRYHPASAAPQQTQQQLASQQQQQQQVAVADQNGSYTSQSSFYAQPSNPAGNTDAFITNAIRSALQNDRSLSDAARNIKINVSNGVVTLSGTVASDAERARIASMAQISGVTSVSNQINVQ